MSDVADGTGTTLHELAPDDPPVGDLKSPRAVGVPQPTPDQIIFFYEPNEWETFVREWASTLAGYVDVKQLGGAGDRGIDVAAFHTDQALEGPWDCYQCKHYSRPLRPTDLWPEIYKVILASKEPSFSLPQKYRILAPQGCGTALERLLISPSELRKGFLDALGPDRPLGRDGHADDVEFVVDAAGSLDFSCFGSVPVDELVVSHAAHRNHARRFGVQLPSRPPTDSHPAEPEPHEARYLKHLMDAYTDAFAAPFDAAAASSDERTENHYRRQREAFYRAESLRVFARDAVPEGTFESLQGELYDGVVEVHESPHAHGLERLNQVLLTATQVQLAANDLISLTEVADRKGICHQLAGEDRLIWVRE